MPAHSAYGSALADSLQYGTDDACRSFRRGNCGRNCQLAARPLGRAVLHRQAIVWNTDTLSGVDHDTASTPSGTKTARDLPHVSLERRHVEGLDAAPFELAFVGLAGRSRRAGRLGEHVFEDTVVTSVHAQCRVRCLRTNVRGIDVQAQAAGARG